MIAPKRLSRRVALTLTLACGIMMSTCSGNKSSGGAPSGGGLGPDGSKAQVLKRIEGILADYGESPSEGSDAVPSLSSSGECAATAVEEDVKVAISQCGIANFKDPEAKTFETVQTETYARVIDAGFSQAILDLTSTLTLKGKLNQQTLDVAITHGNYTALDVNRASTTLLSAKTDKLPDFFKIEKEKTLNDSEQFRNLIQVRSIELGQKFAGPVTAKTIMTRIAAKSWKGIVCTIRGSDVQTNDRSGFHTESKYEPAFAPSISPIADQVRYPKELGDFRYFKDIKATVTNTNNPVFTENPDYKEKMAKGEPYTITGSIFIEKIPPERHIPRLGPDGKPIVIKGDTAYRVTNRFGTNEETLALGFHLWTEYYIDHSQRSFSGFVTEVGDEQPRYFVGQYIGKKETRDVTYAKDIQPLMDRYCTSCHRASGSSTDLSTFEAVSRFKDSIVGRVQTSGAGEIGADSMPPSGFPKAEEDAAKKLFFDWKENGFK